MVHFADSEFPQELLVKIVCLLPNWHDKWQLSLANAVIKRRIEKAITVREVDANEKNPLKIKTARTITVSTDNNISIDRIISAVVFSKKLRTLSIKTVHISKSKIRRILVAAAKKSQLEVLVPQSVFFLYDSNLTQMNMTDSSIQLEAVYDSDEEQEEREEQEKKETWFHKCKEDDYQKTNAVAISIEEIKADKELVAQRLGEEYVECVIFFSKLKLMVTTINSCTIAISRLKIEDDDSSNTFDQLCTQSKATGKWKLFILSCYNRIQEV